MTWKKEHFLAKLRCNGCEKKQDQWFEGRDTTLWNIPKCCEQEMGATEVIAYFQDADGKMVEASSNTAAPVVIASGSV